MVVIPLPFKLFYRTLMNVNITCYGSSADLFGMSAEDGGNFGFRLYKNKLVVGKGESGEQTFYLK